MATNTKAASTELVEIFVPRGLMNDDPNLFVSVNGTNYLLPKGKKSKVPKSVAYEINRSLEAQAAYDEKSEKLANESK